MKTKLTNSPWLWPVAAMALIALIIVGHVVGGSFGRIGRDPDDQMRLLQIRDFMQGQSWFDVSQYRLGLEGGTAMHWSRIPDMPVIALTWIFDLFLSYEAAEKMAYVIWPPLSLIGLMYGVWVGLKHIGGQYSRLFGVILILFLFVKNFRFFPGAIDHHNLQMIMLAIALGFAIDPKSRMRSYAIAGISCAISLAIGMEVMVYIGIFCAFFALNWLFTGTSLRRATIAFGAAFSLTFAVIYVSTIAPQSYGAIHCDAFSAITLLAGLLGGLGLALAALTLSNKSFPVRLGGLALLGGVCGALFLLLAPQCLSNPLNDLPPIVQELWLADVIEAQSFWDLRAKWSTELAYMFGIQFTAVAATIWQLAKGGNKRIFGLLLALSVAALCLSFYQIRFYIFGFLFSIIPLGHWIGELYAVKQAKPDKAGLGYLFALAVSLPYVWSIAVVFKDAESMSIGAEACVTDRVIETLAELPTGVVLANSSEGTYILLGTTHRALNANYHRNAAGIKASLEMAIESPKDARLLLEENKVDYIQFCRPSAETETLVEYAPDGLFAHLMTRNTPDYLTPIGPDLEEGAVTFYKVNRR